ncbi:PREDICTED: elongation factor Ts, mitochondrial isoform X2 [Nicrophorus vespilloides]|nr:PREDICTED: elongation factor Ts, mitochondrial isoform X2 [Nicrophorus vespilloides]XP_017769742.1 PREDICTED: elongation factor Ts, mitochondrial isoform X2 [Nicrophorus vespilloides]XP_017769743.1 PREDICTED: elongation factor Ts, mitochondrial isoform X2 [Nicrophorus vespilloides]
MIGKYFVRKLHTSFSLFNVEKSMLATLRKKTGYTFSNCKKALELHNNDLTKAEEWLKQQAQSLGWSKATKLQGRQATQGLVGVLIKNNTAALVEVNCETDFVARNEHFQNMVHNVANTCIQHAPKPQGDRIVKVCFDTEQLKDLKTNDGKSLSDHLALMIGTVGENAVLKRAMCFKVDDNVHLSSYAHPAGNNGTETLMGRFGGVIALKQNIDKEVNLDELGKKLCQHVVGLDPKKVGCSSDIPEKNVEDETCLIYQEYLHDENFSVKEILEENGVEVVDFKRFGCGETGTMEQPLENVETCQ